MYTILVVSDSKTTLLKIQQILLKKYSVVPVLSGELALRYLEKNKPDLILLDDMVPEMDGLETMKRIKESPRSSSIPIIIMTEDTTGITEAESLKLGVSDFITKPFVPEVMMSRIHKTIEIENYHIDLEQRLLEKSQEMELITLQAITVIANTLDAKDGFARGHSTRVASYSTKIATKLGWSTQEVQNLHYVALLHDIGKIGVSDAILNKSSTLTPIEYEIIKSHTIIGGEIVKDINLIHQVKEGVLYHHERYDGTGYPEALKGEEIPMIARILAVADAYDAMTSERTYQKKMSKDEVMLEFRECSGTQFDPKIASLFLHMLEEDELFVEEGETAGTLESNFIKESSLLLQRVIEQREAKVKREASRDHLTGLYNRRAAEVKINQFAMEPEKKGAFFMMDIDNFKLVNDGYGHIAGDYVLKKVARLFLQNARDTDLVCRLGGDEFVIFYKDVVHRDMLKKKADKILSDFALLRSEDETMKQTSLSIGIALLGVDGEDFEHLYVKADKSLYYVKQNGKSSYHFYSVEDELVEEADTSTNMDLLQLMELMKETKGQKGVLTVGYEEFQRIFDFIQRFIERTKQEVMVILFTLSHKFGEQIHTEDMEEAIQTLEKAIAQSLRRSDVSTRYSNSQFIVVINNTNEAGANLVVDRIYSNFYARNQAQSILLTKDVAPMNSENR